MFNWFNKNKKYGLSENCCDISMPNPLKEKSLNDIIENYKNICKKNNEKLYWLSISWDDCYCMGKPTYNEKLNIIEFIHIKTMKEHIYKLGINDTFIIREI